jgi:hypothetical protein
MLTERQRSHLLFWVTAVIIAEGIMFLFNAYLEVIYGIIALLFLGGFVLRITHLYPGKWEPLILDSLGVVIALIFAYCAHILAVSHLQFILILFSSLIIVPHLIYILSQHEI